MGDGAASDENGYIWTKGRIDDVINLSGYRLSTAGIESVLIMYKGVTETAVIGGADELTGQAVYVFVTLKLYVFLTLLFPLPPRTWQPNDKGARPSSAQGHWAVAAPKKIYTVPDLLKMRSDKIMRRILRKIVMDEGDQLGDLSTVAEPGVVDIIKQKVAESG
ncbi:Acetyl-coenzyme A synthetase [Mycena venus]|uniref:Acetyl-coenzyme A synthetase n=1 Tax=Mycena venus TaxID=2733690 RepID=A0A8H7CP81_9AGAR|nr:Acetyl-coenzyme A synthetase [Mycena venus]